MRHVSGLERPWIQWSFVATGVLLIAIAAAEAVAIRRARAALDTSRAAEMNARLDRQQLEIQLTHERSSREALAIEVSRLRGSTPASADLPTLTLTPLMQRGATPPAASADGPSREQVIELRLLLPRDAPQGLRDVTLAMRGWSSGQTLWTRGGLAVSSFEGRAVVTTLITGDALAPGAYELLLTGATGTGQPSDIASYEVSIAPAKH